MRHAPAAGHASTNVGPAPLATVGVITFLNSLGSGLLWSGVFFVTEQQFEWNQAQNFLLALGATIVYAVAAFTSGRIVAALDHRHSARRVIALLMVLQIFGGAAALVGPVGVIICAILASGTGAVLWPIMEAYLSAARHGHALRRAIGIFNLTWMGAVGASMLVMAPAIAAGYPTLGLFLFVPISVVSIFCLPWLPSRPPPHGAAPEEAPVELAPAADPASAAATAAQRVQEHRHRPPSERALRDATRVLLPVGYILIGGLGPALPFLLGALDVAPGWRTPVTAVWMASRVLTVALLIQFSFWHGRAAALVVGFALAAGGFATIALAESLGMMIAGLACFGAGQAIIYYAALYYAMVVGGAEVHAGSVFEALIGLGYGVGPIVGLIAGGANVAYVWSMLALSVAITIVAFRKVIVARVRSRRPRAT